MLGGGCRDLWRTAMYNHKQAQRASGPLCGESENCRPLGQEVTTLCEASSQRGMAAWCLSEESSEQSFAKLTDSPQRNAEL